MDGCYDFRADIGVLMNITPDHLDPADYELQNYVDSKFRILRNQRPEDRFYLLADDPLTLGNLPKHPLGMQTLPFSVKTADGCAAMLADGVIRAEVAGKRVEIPVAELKIKGTHNYNAMATFAGGLVGRGSGRCDMPDAQGRSKGSSTASKSAGRSTA